MNALSYYVDLPWTIRREERYDDGTYIALRIAELPGFVVAAPSEAKAELMFWPALEAFLSSYLEEGEEPPLPAGAHRAAERHRQLAGSAPPEIVFSAEGEPEMVNPAATSYGSIAEAEQIPVSA